MRNATLAASTFLALGLTMSGGVFAQTRSTDCSRPTLAEAGGGNGGAGARLAEAGGGNGGAGSRLAEAGGGNGGAGSRLAEAGGGNGGAGS
ncbi:MAG TPA: hypothetical protein VLI93_06130, partial [Acetobacteraceae bacterium]|nr:hypothetical protein [Acetobacteraceae bacterium]